MPFQSVSIDDIFFSQNCDIDKSLRLESQLLFGALRLDFYEVVTSTQQYAAELMVMSLGAFIRLKYI